MKNIVTDFGADPTGATSSSAAFQNAANDFGDSLEIPPGLYQADGIDWKYPKRVVGPGSHRIGSKDAAAVIFTTSDTADIFKINTDHIIMEGLHLRGTAARTTTGKGSAIIVGGDQRAVADAAMTVNNNVVTSATANFTAADIGAKCRVVGAFNGSSVPVISIIVSPTTAELSFNADNAVSGATATIAHVRENVHLTNMSTASHSIGLWLMNASNARIVDGIYHGWYSIFAEDRVAPDKGENEFRGVDMFAEKAAGSRCLFYKSGGSLRLLGGKSLNCDDAIHIEWKEGVSGGILIEGHDVEEFLSHAILGHGDGTTVMYGMSVVGSTINGGSLGIKLHDNFKCKRLRIVGNGIRTPGRAVEIGSGCDGVLIDANQIATNSADPIYSAATNTTLGTNQILPH